MPANPQLLTRPSPPGVRNVVREPLIMILVGLIFVILGIFILFPLVKVVQTSLTTPKGYGLANYIHQFKSWYVLRSLYNSLLMGVLSAVGACLIGFTMAYAQTRANFPGKRFFELISIVPIISPPFIGAISLLFLFGNNGLITRHLLGIYNYPIYGLRGLLIAQIMTFFPVAYLSLKGILEAIDPTLEDAALDIGASRWQVFSKVFFPLAIPGIASSLLIIFVESLADFGNPLILAGSEFPTLAVQAYLQITGMYDLKGGAALAVALLIPSLTAFLIQKYYVAKRHYTTVTGKPTQSSVSKVNPLVNWLLFVFCVLVSVAVLLFYGVIIFGAFAKVWGYDNTLSLRNFAYVFDVGLDAVIDTIQVAIAATPISAILGMLIAFLVVRQRFMGRSALEMTALLNFALPGTVVGIGYILAFNTRPFLLTGTMTILVLNFVFRYMPAGIENGVAALQQIDPSIEEAARDLGASSLVTFRKVTLPLVVPAFFSALVFSFVRAMTAISAAVFLVSARWNLITVQILNQVGSGRLGVAAAFSVVLVVVVLLAIFIIKLLLEKVYGLKGIRLVS